MDETINANDENQPKDKTKTAFFITPLGSDDSTIRRSTNGVINAVIRPILKKHNIFLIPPHEIDNPGNITKQVISQILTADLVIADLTGLNPNVMYELAVRHARRLPVIVICQHGTSLPFDIAAERTFFYHNDMAGAVQLTEQLDRIIPAALLDEKPDNPIYNGLETSIIQKITEESRDPVQGYIVEKLSTVDELSSLVKSFIAEQRGSQKLKLDSRLTYNDVEEIVSANTTTSREWYNPNFLPLDTSALNVGDELVHQKFGLGVLLRVQKVGSEMQLTIDFQKAGTKILLYRMAKDKIKVKPK